jgi:hypothetical protein
VKLRCAATASKARNAFNGSFRAPSIIQAIVQYFLSS